MTVGDDTLCDCGSKLTAHHCCALDPVATPPLDYIDDEIRAAANRAAENFKQGEADDAERLCLSVLERAPRFPLALATLGEIRMKQGKRRAALALFARLAEADLSNFWPINKLAMLELERGNVEAAEDHARQGIRLAPENPQAHNLMAMVMTEAHRPVLGEFHCRRALELAGRRIPLVLSNLATCLTNQGRVAEARALYEEADQLAPNNHQTLLAWARMEEADRCLDAAEKLLARLEQLGPLTGNATLAKASVLERQRRGAEALALLDSENRAQPLKPVERLVRGRLLDKMGRFDEAWAEFEGGKADFRALSGRAYLQDEAEQLANDLKSFFTRHRVGLLPAVGIREDRPQPVFILGFPRSGTTLLEQTLTASPDVSAGDELPIMHEIAASLPRVLNSPWQYPGSLAELWMADHREELDSLRDHYLKRARQLGAAREHARLFTDKMPLNETHLGLIALLFPASPLLHVVRHPLDIMVSAMSNMFNHGGYCGLSLETAARHLVLTTDLVAHYRAEMDLNYLSVRYEDMVEDQEATFRRIFEHAGVPFDAAFLQQEKNPRYARTASYAQVTEPLYRTSTYRYRHYLRHLQPAIPILAPLIERLGYIVEEDVKPKS